MGKLDGRRIAILATRGFEQSELKVPQQRLEDEGATVDIVSPRPGKITGWNEKDWGDDVSVDRTLDEVSPEQYDALVLPGGQINPDILRLDPNAVKFVRNFHATGKPLAAICHGPWMLVEADIVRGRRVTSWPSLRTDLANAGAEWSDDQVVVDQGLITSRKPDDLDAFCAKIVEEMHAGAHRRSDAAE